MTFENIEKPNVESYWVVPGKFLAGEFPGDFDENYARIKIKSLIETGVSAFIDITEEDEGLLPYNHLLSGQSYQRFPIRDGSIPQSPEKTIQIIDTIDDHIANNRTVYLHCWGGVGRTGLIVGCWLSRHGFKGKMALDRLHELWQQRSRSIQRESPETIEQQQYILDWNETP